MCVCICVYVCVCVCVCVCTVWCVCVVCVARIHYCAMKIIIAATCVSVICVYPLLNLPLTLPPIVPLHRPPSGLATHEPHFCILREKVIMRRRQKSKLMNSDDEKDEITFQQSNDFQFLHLGQPISNYSIAPLFGRNGAQSGFEMCFGPSTLGAEAKTRLESRIKKFTPHTSNSCTWASLHTLLIKIAKIAPTSVFVMCFNIYTPRISYI